MATGMCIQTRISRAMAMSSMETAEYVLLIGNEILWWQLPGITKILKLV